MQYKRILAMGDIHGEYKKAESAAEKSNVHSAGRTACIFGRLHRPGIGTGSVFPIKISITAQKTRL